ncbi:unnamed protein product [Brassicogethes aeneus]|uniref:SH2 domain-containing protein n=1 Tax=Brassicogethes aeneus TaxID=1431903 RepID=A0A9P0B9S5_BRAAE|nr:unnamed protein product [Brassicogethes aeneus]
MSLDEIKSFSNYELINFFKKNNLKKWVPFLEENNLDGKQLMNASEYEIKIWSNERTKDLWNTILKIKSNPSSFNHTLNQTKVSRTSSFSQKNFLKLEGLIGNLNNINKSHYSNEEDERYLEPIGGDPKGKNSKIPIPQKFNNQKPFVIPEIPKLPRRQQPTYEIEESYEDIDDIQGRTRKTYIGNPKVNPKPLSSNSERQHKTYVNQSPNFRRNEKTENMNLTQRSPNVSKEDTYECIDEMSPKPNGMRGRKLPPIPTENPKQISIKHKHLPPTPDNDIYECEIEWEPEVPRNPIVNLPKLPLDLKHQIHSYNKTSLNSILNRPLPQIPDQSYVTLTQRPNGPLDVGDSSSSQFYLNMSPNKGKGRPPLPIPSEEEEDFEKYINKSTVTCRARPFSPGEYINHTGADDYLEMHNPNANTRKQTSYDQHFPSNLSDLASFKSNTSSEDDCFLKDNLNNEPFYRNTDRKGAKLLLRDLDDGVFLFRHSENPRFFLTLTIKYNKQFFNIGIIKIGNKIRCDSLMEELTPEFSNLTDFISYFQKEPITIRNNKEYSIYLNPILPMSKF